MLQLLDYLVLLLFRLNRWLLINVHEALSCLREICHLVSCEEAVDLDVMRHVELRVVLGKFDILHLSR